MPRFVSFGWTALLATIALASAGCGSADREAAQAREEPAAKPPVSETAMPEQAPRAEDTAHAETPTAGETVEGEATMAPAEKAAARPAGSGVEGVVTLGPTCPVAEKDRPCPARPYVSELVIREQDSGRVVRELVSDDEGVFRVELPPGRYILEPPPRTVVTAPAAQPIKFAVEPNRYTRVELRFDSGIR